MNSSGRNPIWCIVKCQMCAERVANYTLGLCVRCIKNWSVKRPVHPRIASINSIRAGMVAMTHTQPNYARMDAPFRDLLQEEQRSRQTKMQLFHSYRQKYQLGVLLEHLEKPIDPRHEEKWDDLSVSLESMRMDREEDMDLFRAKVYTMH